MKPTEDADLNLDRSGSSRGRPSFPRERIVREALTLVDDSGAEALTLRSLAGRLGSSTSTLYRHFTDRAQLIDEVIDAVFTEIQLDVPEQPDWAAELRNLASSMFDAITRHPGVTPLLLEGIPATTHVLAVREHTLGLLLGGGFPASDAVRVFATIGRFVLGFGVQARIAGALDIDAPDPESSPASARVAEVGPYTLEDEFRFGLALLISGLHANRTETRTTGAR